MRCRLAGVSKPRSRIWYAFLTAPRNDSPLPLLRPLRRSLSARGFVACRLVSSCHLLRRVAHVRVCAAYSQWSSVSREHPPRRLARQTSPAAAVTSPRIVLNYKKNRILCGLRLVLGLFLALVLVIFENRKTPRFDACQKIAVRCRLDRNGCITSSYFNFAPDKTSRWQIVGPPRIIARRFAF